MVALASAGSSGLDPAGVPTGACSVSAERAVAEASVGVAVGAASTAAVVASLSSAAAAGRGTRASAGSSFSPLVPRTHTSPWFSTSNSGGGLLPAIQSEKSFSGRSQAPDAGSAQLWDERPIATMAPMAPVADFIRQPHRHWMFSLIRTNIHASILPTRFKSCNHLT